MFLLNQVNIAADGPGVSLFLLLLIVGFVLAMIWIVNYEPKKKETVKVREEINKAFDELRDYARIYDRNEFLEPLHKTKVKVDAILDKAEIRDPVDD